MLAIPETTIPRLGTYYLQTYGCQMNQYDSELLAHMLEGMGLAASEDAEHADVAVFNTCCIRDNADQKVYGRMGDFKRYKQARANQVADKLLARTAHVHQHKRLAGGLLDGAGRVLGGAFDLILVHHVLLTTGAREYAARRRSFQLSRGRDGPAAR